MQPTIKCGRQTAEHTDSAGSRFHDVNLGGAIFDGVTPGKATNDMTTERIPIAECRPHVNYAGKTMRGPSRCRSRRPARRAVMHVLAGLLAGNAMPAALAPGARTVADAEVIVFASPDPARVSAYSPGIMRLASGRLVATLDLGGPGMPDWPEPKGIRYGRPVQGKVFTSDDSGQTWTHRADYPFMHARPFVAGDALYVLGQCEDLMIIRSDDDALTWGRPAQLTHGEDWTQAPCNVHYANGCVYLVMNKRPHPHKNIWPVSVEAPVLMRGRLDGDLTHAENWTFANTLAFRDVVAPKDLDWFGIPFYESRFDETVFLAPRRGMAPIGWLETNVVQFTDPDHLWHDASGRTFHLWSRAHTGGTGYACIAKAVEQGDTAGTGAILTMLEQAPSGKAMLYVPCPGGQMKFHVLHDGATGLFWLLSTQATDSMTRPERLPPDRFGLPNNERRRLQLHFSKNMVDWCFAGLVAVGPVEKGSRHYASMAIDGADLVVLSRSGDARARSAHDGNLITFHRIPDFRKLVY
jgi:hypothetical protein